MKNVGLELQNSRYKKVFVALGCNKRKIHEFISRERGGLISMRSDLILPLFKIESFFSYSFYYISKHSFIFRSISDLASSNYLNRNLGESSGISVLAKKMQGIRIPGLQPIIIQPSIEETLWPVSFQLRDMSGVGSSSVVICSLCFFKCYIWYALSWMCRSLAIDFKKYI